MRPALDTSGAVWLDASTTVVPLPQTFVGPDSTDQNLGATCIDYNGTIYGADHEINNSIYYGVDASVEWPNDASVETSLDYIYTPDASPPASSGSRDLISEAKNNHTIGTLISYNADGTTFTTSYTVNQIPVNFTPMDINSVGWAVSYDGSGNGFLYENGFQENLPGILFPSSLNHATRTVTNSGVTTSVECPQIIGYDSQYMASIFQKNPQTGQYEHTHFTDLLDPNSGWTITGLGIYPGATFNDSGCMIGTANYTPPTLPPGASPPANLPATGQHGVLLIPLQLRLLDGTTADFDATTPQLSWAPESEFPEHDAAVDITGVTALGPDIVGPSGQAQYQSGYYWALMVAAQAPATIPGIQYRWKRYIKDRDWYFKYNTTTGQWDVSLRDTSGTASYYAQNNGADDNGQDGTAQPSDSTPSQDKHEFYAADFPGIVYGKNQTDNLCVKDNYIAGETTFTYNVQYSFDGKNWDNGTTLIFTIKTTFQFSQNFTGSFSSDINVIRNTIYYGDNDPTMSPTKAAFIVGSANVNLLPDVNDTTDPIP